MFRRIQNSTTKRRHARRAFTLIEVMVATVIFTVGAIAALITFFHSFRAMARARYLDRAANILKIAADQFQSSKARDPGTAAWRSFFVATPGGATGEGMAWNRQLQTLVQVGAGANIGADYIEGVAAGLTIPMNTLGATDAEAPTATLTRQVDWITINPATGATSFNAAAPSAVTNGGQLIRGIFRIQFNYLGRTEQLQTVVVRNLNPTDK
ncbi:type II secretion system protein [Nibricoccus sp. IMCC34717]|uniref:type II secretion system protein n=1 Tax=Nibricoccus sp. IMCC34717 TaxID=3034021 RepID=UPI0038515648